MAAKNESDVVDSLVQLSFLIQAALTSRAGERELSLVQARLLGVLRDRTPTMNQLATLLELDKSSVTGLVARAEGRGLVERRPSPTDGRSVVVTLTTAGRRVIRTVADRFGLDVAGMLDGLSTGDRHALARAAGRVVAQHAARHGIDLTAGAAVLG